MKKNYVLILLSLLISLVIYLFYRTENTVISELLIPVITTQNYISIQKNIIDIAPLNEFIIYSLPEGLWVFSVTLLSKSFYIKFYKYKINILLFPIIFAIGLELIQLLNISHGRFDYWDILSASIFWSLAIYLPPNFLTKKSLNNPFNIDGILCISSYLIVYLSYVTI